MKSEKNILVDRKNFASLTVQSNDLAESLGEGQALLKIERFALTANNITYAATGDFLKYWDFFPTLPGKGIIPVWGFAEVLESNCDEVEVGARFYGYYPMSSHLVVEPGSITKASFVDASAHRSHLSLIYNQYIRCDRDPMYQADQEASQMILRPLFTTSFLLDDMFGEAGNFGASTIVLTSASSKTALGMAFLLHRNRASREQQYKIVGLTSASNKAFVEGLACYDTVLTYDELDQLDASVPTTTVDFAGNGEVLGQLHSHLNDNLTYSCLVGASHWDQRGGMPENLAGPAPQLFFAPSQAEKRLKEWGGAEFQRRIAEVWLEFVDFVDGWIEFSYGHGSDELIPVYQDVLAGKFDPKAGYILSLWDE